MAYNRHNWSVNEPITLEKMQNIEDGIWTLDSNLTNNYYTRNQLDNTINPITGRLGSVEITAEQARQNAVKGVDAYNEVVEARNGYNKLKNNLDNIRSAITTVSGVANTANNTAYTASTTAAEAKTTINSHITNNFNPLKNEITEARNGKTSLYLKISEMDTQIDNLVTEVQAGDSTTTLQHKLETIDNKTETNKSSIQDTNTEITNIEATLGYSVSAEPEQTIKNIIDGQIILTDEITEAHREDHENDSLNTRFEDIETSIGLISGNSGVLEGVNGRLSDLESADVRIFEAIRGLNNEIVAAHRLDSNNEDHDSLALRFAAIESILNDLSNRSSTIVLSESDFTLLRAKILDENDPTEGDPNVDYIVGPDNKGQYYYWKWIDDSAEEKWKLISGGGSGNSSGIVCASEAEFQIISPKEENVDYYVLMDDNKYHHYRYYNENIIEIGHVVDETQLSSTITSSVTSSINTTLNETVTNLTNKIKRYRIKKSEQNDNNYLELYEFQYTDEIPELAEDYPSTNLISSILLPAGGGGGGSSTNAKLTVARRTPQNYYVLASENTIQLGIFFSSYDDTNKELYNGNYTLYRGGTIIDTGELLTDELHLVDDTGNYVSKYFDIKNYCNPGVQNFTLVVTDTAGNLQRREWRVELVELYLTTEFDDKRTYPANTTRKINIVPFGSGGISKTIVASIDNANSGAGYITITTTTSGSPQELTIPASILTPGTHLLKIYVKQIIGQNLEPTSSKPIYLDLVCINNTVQKPIISSIYRRDETNTQEPISVPQYTSLKIPYYVYDPIDSSPTVTISKTFDNITTSVTENLKDSNGTYIFKGQDEGNYFITISCKNSSITIPIVVTALGYEINPITEGLIFDFNPVGLSNTSTSRMWTNSVEGYENIKFIIPEGESFDWYNGGYQVDEDNNTYFCIKSGSRIAINTSLFNKNYFKESDTDINGSIERSGAEFKCIFKTTNVKRGDATFLTCKDNDQITVTVYDNDITDSSKFKEYLNVTEIYKIKDDKTVILAVVLSDSEDITSIEAAYGDGANHRTINDINLSGKTTELSYSNESLKRYQILNADGTIYCIYEEQYDNEHNGWIITRIKPVSSVLNTNLGLEMKAHEVNITSRSGVLTTPYSEDDRIEFEYNINSKTKGSYMLAYEDGVSTLPLLYYSTPGRDNFIHNSPGYIILGSDDCDLHIYRMKFYNKSLTNQQILMNFYADAPDGEEMVQRYERNTKLYNDPHSESGILSTITPQSVANACPNLKVLMIEAPQLTGGKKDFVKNTKIRCIQKNGRPEDNWVAFNAYHSGQGTSSDNYGMSGRNLDIIFGFNGVDTVIVPKKNNYSFDANYKSVVVTGVTNNFDDVGDYNSTLTDLLTEYNALHPSAPLNADSKFDDIEVGERHLYRNGTGKISLSKTSVPNNWFNIKVNIASSENANNALLQKRFDRYLPYDSPAKKRDSNIKNDMEFYNTVIFIRETGTPTEFKEDARIEASQRPWHFYGIGNIGDSKKTDNTRVNIPGDPNEFCIEISDNGLANSGFDTGVYYVDNDPNKGTTYNKQYGINSLIKYPISSAEWTNPNNLAHKSLYDLEEENEVNWDKSFEFRYDLTTKDGNTIDEEGAAGELAAQRLLNNKRVFADMYSWIATCPNASFANELSNWFVEESPLYWYLFTERYTMIDSRAKNTFYHYGKYYITTAEAAGDNISTLEAELADLTEGTKAYAIKLTELNTARFIYENSSNFIVNNDKAAINNGYRFDMWDYDNDTALGINNNGKMVFNYGLEDTDKLSNGSWVYNEATSVFWRRIRENCYSKLSIVFNKVNKDCWNAENLIKEFDTWQEQFPEEIWRLDFERKYLRPYTVYSENKYLKDMANGRKKYQRRQFERDMAIYIYSKYNMGSAYESDDTIEFRTRATSASGLSLAIKPYGTMYVNVMFGNTETIQQKVQAGELVSINPPTSFVGADNTQIIIYNASRIQEIGALAGWQLDTMKFSKATKLQKLILGADSPFNNNYEQQLTLANPILEELDIRNYTNMQPTLDLTNCPNLKILKAQGTNVQVITFASGGLLQETYYPSTLTDIYFTNLNHLNTVSLDGYANLAKIESLDTAYNIQSIVNNSINNLESININNINWTNVTQTMMEKLYSLSVSSILKGTIYMSGLVEEGVLVKYRAKWPELTINTDGASIIHQYEVIFQYTDVEGGLHTYSQYVTQGQMPLDPVTEGWLDPLPGKPPTQQYEFLIGSQTLNTETGEFEYDEYSGWVDTDGNPIPYNGIYQDSHKLFIAQFLTQILRRYKVEWYVDGEKVDEKTVQYGQEAVASSDKVPSVVWNNTTQTAKVFNGWDKSSGLIKEDLVGANGVKATWIEGTKAEALEILQNTGLNGLNAAQMYAISKLPIPDKNNYLPSHIGDYKEIQLGNDFNFSNVNSIQIADDDVIGYDPRTLSYNARSIKFFDDLEHYNNIPRYPEIKPIKKDKGFTIALDYTVHSINSEHLNSGLSYEYLLTAYEAMEGVSKGLIIRAPITSSSNTDIELCWGTPDNKRVIGRRGYRNIVVIRRPPNSKILYFYFDNNYINNLNITNTITTATLTMNGDIVDSDIPLVLGCLPAYDGRTESWVINTDSSAPADGVIHWGKYWDEDLGETVSKQLALLCHEKIKFKLIGFDDKEGYSSTYRIYGVGQYSTNPGQAAKLNFAASSLLESQKYIYPSTNQNDAGYSGGGWADSALRTILNDRVYNAFPVAWRSVIVANPLFTYRRQRVSPGSSSYTSSPEFEVDDKIYIPAYKELINTTDTTFSKEAIYRQIPWMDQQYSAWQINSSEKTLLSKQYSRILYVGKTIPNDAQVFYYPLDRNPYNEVKTNGLTLKSGDLWVVSNYSSWMLMYVGREDYNKYRYYYQTIDGGINSNLTTLIKCEDAAGKQDGAWISAGYADSYYSNGGYWTRTLYPTSNTYTFYYIYPNGSSNAYYSYYRRLLLEFSL